MKKNTVPEEDPLAIINEEAKAVAMHYGATWCDEAAALLARRIASRLGGSQLYVPMQTAADRKARDAQLRGRFDGTNVRALAREFRTSERTVRRVLAVSGDD